MPNKSLHLTAIPLRFIAEVELGRHVLMLNLKDRISCEVDIYGSLLINLKGFIMEKIKKMNHGPFFPNWLIFIIGLIINLNLIFFKVFLLTVARILSYELIMFII